MKEVNKTHTHTHLRTHLKPILGQHILFKFRNPRQTNNKKSNYMQATHIQKQYWKKKEEVLISSLKYTPLWSNDQYGN